MYSSEHNGKALRQGISFYFAARLDIQGAVLSYQGETQVVCGDLGRGEMEIIGLLPQLDEQHSAELQLVLFPRKHLRRVPLQGGGGVVHRELDLLGSLGRVQHDIDAVLHHRREGR